MPRVQRKQSQTAIYHVLLRGINQQSIFEDNEDHQHFLELLTEVKAVSEFELFAYCLMGNHVHLLLREGGEQLQLIFRRLNTRYAQWFNWKYQRSGHLFQDRFKSEAVQDDSYFITVIKYIHNNPVKAGLCKKPEKYQWSSLAKLDTKDPLIDWQPLSDIMPLSEIRPFEDKTNSDRNDGEAHDEKDGAYMAGPLDVAQGSKKTYSDEGARELLAELCGARSTSDFQRFDKQTQRALLPRLKGAGLSIRQIVRVTGIGRGIVDRWSRRPQGH